MPQQSNLGALRYAILRAETAWGVHDVAGDDLYVPFWDDGATVEPENAWISQLHTTGVRGDTHVAHTQKNIGGKLVVGLWPELAKIVLDWATVVDGNYDLASMTLTVVDPGIQAMRFYGLRVNELDLKVSEGEPSYLAELDLIGKWCERLTGGAIPALPSYPADISYILQGGALLLDAGGGGGYTDRATFKSFDLKVSNNLTKGRHVRDIEDAKNKTIASLRTGTQRVSGSVDVEHTGPELTDAVLAASEGSVEALFSHPTGAVLTVDAGGAAAGGPRVIPVTTNPLTGPAYSVAKGECVFCETEPSDPDNRSVAQVTALATAPNTVTVANLDRALAAGDKLYGKSMRIRATGLKVSKAAGSGGRESQRNQKYEFRASDDGTGIQFSYLVESP